MGQSEVPKAARDICQQFPLGDRGRALLTDRQTPGEFLALLVQEELYDDAVWFAAHWLPKREAVWWGCLCCWHLFRPQPAAEIALVFEAVLCWVREPSESNRRAAGAAGQALGGEPPAGTLALAIFGSGGSLSLPGLPDVPPPPQLTAQAVVGTVLAAAAKAPPHQSAAIKRQFLAWAAEVADGRNRWDGKPAPTPQAAAGLR